MDIIEKTTVKNNIVKCISVCGGLTGKFAKILCSDESVFQEMMEDGKIRRIPVEVRMSDKSTKKIYLYELAGRAKAPSFPNMKEDDAKYISILNNCYCKFPDAQWLEKTDVKRLIVDTNLNGKLVPTMMFYHDNLLVAVYIHKTYAQLKDQDRQMISEKLCVDKVLEYLY